MTLAIDYLMARSRRRPKHGSFEPTRVILFDKPETRGNATIFLNFAKILRFMLRGFEAMILRGRTHECPARCPGLHRVSSIVQDDGNKNGCHSNS
jgi:hypothetical protein